MTDSTNTKVTPNEIVSNYLKFSAVEYHMSRLTARIPDDDTSSTQKIIEIMVRFPVAYAIDNTGIMHTTFAFEADEETRAKKQLLWNLARFASAFALNHNIDKIVQLQGLTVDNRRDIVAQHMDRPWYWIHDYVDQDGNLVTLANTVGRQILSHESLMRNPDIDVAETVLLPATVVSRIRSLAVANTKKK